MLSPGEMLQNRYRITRQIGGGGMALVYLAADTRLAGRQCAIKEISPGQLHPSDRNWAIANFRQEAQMLANLEHSGLAEVNDFFAERGNWYLVMDYIEGETLGAYLAAHGGRLAVEEALRITRQLCEVLTYLHSQSPPVIFRDLKPGNVMLTSQGDVRLIDFGIARFFKPGKTGDTVNLGTPGYAAPEQYGQMGAQSGPRADVYSLGVLLLQMVSGYDPTIAQTPFPIPDPRSIMRTMPKSIAAVITRATQTRPDLRYGSIHAMQQALFPPTYMLPLQSGNAASSQQPVGSKKALIIMGSLIVLTMVIVGGVSLFNNNDDDDPTPLVYVSPTFTPLASDTLVATTPTSQPALTPTPTLTPLPPATSTPGSTSTPPPTPTPTPTVTPDVPSSDWVLIPPGPFERGSDYQDIQDVVEQLCPAYEDSWCRERAFEDELLRAQVAEPRSNIYYYEQREVRTDGFYIDRCEVSNAAYALCVQAGVCNVPAYGGPNPRHSYFSNSRYADHPVVYVTWYDADTYCRWVGGRLPTADEWEKAARGTEGQWWPWGNESLTNQANYREPRQASAEEEDTVIRGGDAEPCGSYRQDESPYGVMDMAGNVMEWVGSWYGPDRREIRGGSWNTGGFALRVAGRTGREPDQVYFDVGFRCARDASP